LGLRSFLSWLCITFNFLFPLLSWVQEMMLESAAEKRKSRLGCFHKMLHAAMPSLALRNGHVAKPRQKMVDRRLLSRALDKCGRHGEDEPRLLVIVKQSK
jgi:hypothetical protein